MSSSNKGRRCRIKVNDSIDIGGEIFIKVIPFDFPLDGLVYAKHEVSVDKVIFGFLSSAEANPYKASSKLVAATAKCSWRTDGLYLCIKNWPGPLGDAFHKKLRSGAKIIPVGCGCVDEKGYVRDYRLITFHLDQYNENLAINPIS